MDYRFQSYNSLKKCPCCGYKTLSIGHLYQTCFLCNWEDDGQNDTDAYIVKKGPNGIYSLKMARENFNKYLIMFKPVNEEDYFINTKEVRNKKEEIMELYKTLDLINDDRERSNLLYAIQKKKEELVPLFEYSYNNFITREEELHYT